MIALNRFGRDNVFAKYASPRGETSFYKGIPIKDLEAFRAVHAALGITFRIRFRGPRDPKRYNRQYHCLRTEATSFSVYAPSERRVRRPAAPYWL